MGGRESWWAATTGHPVLTRFNTYLIEQHFNKALVNRVQSMWGGGAGCASFQVQRICMKTTLGFLVSPE